VSKEQSGLVLDSSGTANGSGVLQATNSGASNQECYRPGKDETGLVITDSKSGRVVEDKGFSANNGTQL
jgi:hypothetical protein